MEAVWRSEDRLRLRLGSRAPEVEHYETVADLLAKAHRRLASFVQGDGITEGQITELGDQREAAFRARLLFFDAAAKRFGPDAVDRVSTGFASRLPRRT